MKLNKPKNENYAAVVVKINTLVPLEKCDNVQGAIIMGNQVIVSKDVKVGDVGIYFPLECQLSKEYLSNNNLYDKPELNTRKTERGYFKENGRVRCQRLRGHKSEGLFMPFSSLVFIGFDELNIGDCFDELNGVPICKKYKVTKQNGTPGQPGTGNKTRSTKKYESKLVADQFRFHKDTSMLYRNLHRLNPDSLIQVSYKMHGTSGISSYLLCKKKLNWKDRLLHKMKSNIKTEEYDYIYSSRNVIKNEHINPNPIHFYKEDIWAMAHKELTPFLQKGMTLYYEIVGFLSNGTPIQKDYDYGCQPNKHAIYIYRITQTNVDGQVYEFSAKQVQDWCKLNELNAVPELYYGYARDLYFEVTPDEEGDFSQTNIDIDSWRTNFLKFIKELYNEKDCFMCNAKVPEEGCVVRIEGLGIETYKQKSERFYQRETALLDKGESNIEDEN